ncbi:MAG: hypothetical protein Q9159_004065 [Coniocarpon cinnabarinum]
MELARLGRVASADELCKILGALEQVDVHVTMLPVTKQVMVWVTVTLVPNVRAMLKQGPAKDLLEMQTQLERYCARLL